MTDPIGDALRELVRGVVREELAGVQSPQPQVRLLSVEEAASRLGVGRTWMYEAVNRGQVRSIKLGRRRLVPTDALDEFVESLDAQNGAAL